MSHKQVIQDWKVEISCIQREIGESFSVFIFLGDIPTDPTRWWFDPALAGTFDIYTYTSDNTSDDHKQGGGDLFSYMVLSFSIVRFCGY